MRIILPTLRSAGSPPRSSRRWSGEFSIANLFCRNYLQVAMYLLGKSDAQISVAVGLVSLVFAFLILFAMSFVGSAGPGGLRRRLRTRKETV